MVLGMAEYLGGNNDAAEGALLAAEKAGLVFPTPAAQSGFYRAMSLFQRGKADGARKLAVEAAAKMKPLPKDEKNPLADGASVDDLLLWLAYKEAKGLIRFDAASAPSKGR